MEGSRSGDTNPSIIIVGAGAIGGITAAVLARKGHDVTLVCKYPDYAELVSDEGIQVFGVHGSFIQRIRAVATPADTLSVSPGLGRVDAPFDIAMIATKAQDMRRAAESLLPVIGPDTPVVSMQNGICEDALAKIVGEERVVGCVVGWGATMHDPGVLEMTSEGEFVVGRLDGRVDPRIRLVADILSAVVPAEISQNIMGNLYSKLIINSCITGLGAVSGLTLGRMLRIAKVRRIFIAIMREAMAVADSMRIKIEPYAGRLDYYSFFRGESLVADLRRHVVICSIGAKYRRLKSSSLQSLERGKRTEIDFFNGYIAAKGDEAGIETPVNDVLVRMVKEIEEGQREIAGYNLDDPSFAGI